MISTNNWKPFRLDSVFVMKNTKSIVQKDITPDSGIIPYVTASNINNGVLTYIDCPCEWIDDGNCIMIGGKTMTFSYQKEAFCSNDSHNIALYLKDQTAAKETCYLFLITALRASLFNKYSWGDSISMKRIKNDVFHIPANKDNKPDFLYMDSYMKTILMSSQINLSYLSDSKWSKKIIDVIEWKELSLCDLFDFKLPQGDIQIKKIEDGDTVLITPSAYNNGVFQRISSKSKSTLFPANTLTVDMFGNSYFQEESYFVTAHGHVNVLIPKIRLNKYSGMFIATTIRNMFLEKYGFTQMCTLKVLNREKIKLPVLKNGDLNTEYMESYMRDILDKSSNHIDFLSKVLP